MDEHALTDRAPELEAIREAHLRRLLEQLESGALEPYEYTRRVHALENATTAAEMTATVGTPKACEPALDPVDLLLLSRPTPTRGAGRRQSRYWWMAVIGVFFVLLLVFGMWLVSRATNLQRTGGLGATPAAGAQYLSSVSPPSSVRSPRK